MGWLRQWREAREARGQRTEKEIRQVHEELRDAVVRLMSGYDSHVEHGDNQIEVRGGPGTCPFDIWMPAEWVNLAAGYEREYVLEWVLTLPGELAHMVALLERIVAGDLADLPLGSNKTRLEGYSGYVSLAPNPRSL